MKKIGSLLVALSAVFLSHAAAASSCLGPSPFDDVAQNDAICSNTEWLKNRGVTLGCTANLYCPLQSVSRAQMALFMNRLAVALVPSVNLTDDITTAVDLGLPSFHCVTPQYVITDFARQLVLIGHVSALLNAAGTYSATIVYNTTGVSNDFDQFATGTAERTAASAATYAHASTSTAVNLDVGTTYRFALRVLRVNGATDAASVRCNLMQMLLPRERNSILP